MDLSFLYDWLLELTNGQVIFNITALGCLAFLIWHITNHIPTQIKEVKSEIKEVKSEIKEVKSELETQIKEVKKELETQMKEDKADIQKGIERLGEKYDRIIDILLDNKNQKEKKENNQ